MFATVKTLQTSLMVGTWSGDYPIGKQLKGASLTLLAKFGRLARNKHSSLLALGIGKVKKSPSMMNESVSNIYKLV